jgi:ATP synthase protein I
MNTSPAGRNEDEAFVQEVRRQAERSRGARQFTFWQGLNMAGAVGWMVSLPAALGALLGRWVDLRSGSGIAWTLSLLLLGLSVGCASAWRHVKRELKG